MEARPKIKIPLTTIDKVMEIAGWLFVITACILAFYYYYKLPEVIPVHFDITGKPDRYSSKAYLFFLPVLALILFTGMTWLNKYPHVFNYPVNITPENAERHYRFSTRMLRFVKMVLAFIFCLILFRGGLAATGKATSLGWWFIPLVLCITIIPAIYGVVRSFRLNK